MLTDTERDLGVAVVDVGAGTTSLALFMDGWPFHTAVLPIGGNNVTNDLMIGLKTSLQVAEDVKVQHGCADLRAVPPQELITVSVFGEEQGRTLQRAEACDIIEARMRASYFEQLGEQISAAGRGGILPAGLVMTGGGAQLAGVAEARAGGAPDACADRRPRRVSGLVDHLLTPAFSTSIGLLRLWEREFPLRVSRGATSRHRRVAPWVGCGTGYGTCSRRRAPVYTPAKVRTVGFRVRWRSTT